MMVMKAKMMVMMIISMDDDDGQWKYLSYIHNSVKMRKDERDGRWKWDMMDL